MRLLLHLPRWIKPATGIDQQQVCSSELRPPHFKPIT
jgi:hypothetical protein